MLPKQALHSSIYAASSPEEIDIIDPSAMSNTPSPTGERRLLITEDHPHVWLALCIQEAMCQEAECL